MLSHVKNKHHRVTRPAEFIALNDLNHRTKAQVENLFMSGPWRPTLHQPQASVQPGAIDTRVFNFTGRTLSQVHITGLRTTVHNVNISDYYGAKALRVRDDVEALTNFVPKLSSLQERLVIVQRFNITAHNADEVNASIMHSTFSDNIKQAMRSVPFKNTNLGGKAYCTLDGMFITYVEKAEFDLYEGVHESITGTFFTRVPLALSQPHPGDTNPSFVHAPDFEDEVLNSLSTSGVRVYHDKPPTPLYYNDCGCVIPIPTLHDTSRPEGIYKVYSFPAEKGKAPTIKKLFIEPKELTEHNGYFTSAQGALVMIRQDQMERFLELQLGVLKGLKEGGKGSEKVITDLLTKTFNHLGEIFRQQKDHLYNDIDKIKKDLSVQVTDFKAHNESLLKAALERKIEHDTFMQSRKETLEAAKIIPAVLSCAVAIIAATRKK